MTSDAFTQCVCQWCGGMRLHTPPDCTGCLCDLRPEPTHRVRLKIATIPKPFKDVDELLRMSGPEAYERMILEATPAVAWMIDRLEARGYDLLSPEGKQDASDAMLDTFLSLPVIEQGAYIRRLAERMELTERELRAALNEAWIRNGRKGIPERHSGPKPKTVRPSTIASIDIP